MAEPSIPIPENWTAEQAEAVLDILYALENAIIMAYEQPLICLATRQASEPIHHDDDLDDGVFPF
jgi:hypothetical protein